MSGGTRRNPEAAAGLAEEAAAQWETQLDRGRSSQRVAFSRISRATSKGFRLWNVGMSGEREPWGLQGVYSRPGGPPGGTRNEQHPGLPSTG